MTPRAVGGRAGYDEMPKTIHDLLQRPDGSLVFVDWGQAMVGPAWFDTSLDSSRALVAAGEDTVNAWLVGFGTMVAVRTVTAVDVGLPTLAAFRRTECARMFSAAARQLDLGPCAARQ